MRAVTISGKGASAKLTTNRLNLHEPGAGEVLLAVLSSGVNRADLLQRAGLYPPPPGAPDWPGLEISGSVRALGPGVSWPRVGDRVVALLDGGGYAEQAIAPAGQVLPLPAGIDPVDAAALPEAVCTAWTNLVDAGRLDDGETLLVQGGSGGVGSIAVQLGKALGARVVTTAGGPERTARCRDLGADVVVDHRTEDVVAAVRAATDGRGADVVLDVLGAGALQDNVRLLAPSGRLVVIGLQQGRTGELDLARLMARRATVTGTTLRSRSAVEKAAIVAAVAEHVWPMVADGRVRPVVHARLPLEEAEAAHAMLESGEAFGKVLLLP
ncbi:NAD(P)H-quinone oxidoreductase [Isoptericola chiayiensis]|uniref:NAD(P)H-quinone oxidoreductase n=1 Tax=Isoptericola chiayiensis TaxID=579446 RepID=A0ABP8XZE4_9MICO